MLPKPVDDGPSDHISAPVDGRPQLLECGPAGVLEMRGRDPRQLRLFVRGRRRCVESCAGTWSLCPSATRTSTKREGPLNISIRRRESNSLALSNVGKGRISARVRPPPQVERVGRTADTPPGRHDHRVKRVLLTGMSGVGKSTVAERLSELGYKAIDTDFDGFSEVDEHGYQRWDVDRIRKLLATEDVDVLFVVGSDESQSLFSREFDHDVLLSAPRDVVIERLAARTNNPFGKSPEELAKALADLETFEPMMRRAADHEIDTSKPLDLVIDEILSLIQQPSGR